MAEQASQSQLDKFRNVVKDFKGRYAVLSSNSYGARIARTGDNALMQEYGNTLAKMTTVNNSIDKVLSAYQTVKSYVGLGAIPLIPLAVIAGVSVAVTAALTTMNTFMTKAGIQEIQAENPEMSYTDAARTYQRSTQGVFGKTLDTAQMAMLLGAAVLIYLWIGR